MQKVIVICGPTASGKTALSIELAKRINGEIVSADSMQIYDEMSIGTAKPDVEEMQGIKHYLVGNIAPTTRYSVSDYKNDATKALEEIIEKNKTPIVVGGTGLYVNSLIYGIDYPEVETDLEYRKVKLCQIVMAVRKDHSLLEKTEKKTKFSYPWINLEQCAAEENVMLLPGSLFRKIADEVYAKAEAEPNIVYQISGTRTGLACVAYNHGVMITLDHMIFNNVFAEQILPLSIGEKPMYTDLDLVYMKDTVLTKEIETLKNIMTEAIQ